MSLDEFHLFLTYSYLFGNKRVNSKLSISRVLLMLTGPSVQFIPGHKLWTEPWSDSGVLPLEPRFRTEPYHSWWISHREVQNIKTIYSKFCSKSEYILYNECYK
jgi:hypothetical protein